MQKIRIIIGLTAIAAFLVLSTYFLTKEENSEKSAAPEANVSLNTDSQKTATSETKNTTGANKPAPSATTKPSTGPATYTRAQVASHDSKASCWSIVNGSVYDLTSWISRHPGGEEAIREMCGKDASEDFNEQHRGQDGPEKVLAAYKIGILK